MLHKYGYHTRYAETLQIAESYWKRGITRIRNDTETYTHTWQKKTKNKLRWASASRFVVPEHSYASFEAGC